MDEAIFEFLTLTVNRTKYQHLSHWNKQTEVVHQNSHFFELLPINIHNQIFETTYIMFRNRVFFWEWIAYVQTAK